MTTLDYLLIANVLLNFCRAYRAKNGVVVHDPKAVRQRYMASGFLLDLVACLPLYSLSQAFYGGPHKYRSWLRLPKMLLCRCLWTAFWRSRVCADMLLPSRIV